MVGKITSDAKLTGHTAPVLMGESPYMYPNDLIAKILNAQGRGNYQTDTFSGNEATELGNDLEPFIIGKCAQRLGFDKYNDEITEVYAFEDLFEVSLDGIIFNKTKVIHASDSIKLMNGQDSMTLEGDGVIESKLTSAPYTDVPPPYRGPRQLDMQMMCKGAKWGVIATLYQGTRLVLYVYEANQDCSRTLLRKPLSQPAPGPIQRRVLGVYCEDPLVRAEHGGSRQQQRCHCSECSQRRSHIYLQCGSVSHIER